MFVFRIAFLPVKVGTKATKLAAKTGYRTGRMFGYRRLTVFALGVFVGLLLAPGPGAELREKLKAMVSGNGLASEPDIAAAPIVESSPAVASTTDGRLTVGTNGHN